MKSNSDTIAKPSPTLSNPRNEALFVALVEFLEGIGGVDLGISNEMILSDIKYVADRWGGFESDLVKQVPSSAQRMILLKRAKREVLRRYFQEFVDEITDQRREADEIEDPEERADGHRDIVQNLANYLPEFIGRPASVPRDHAWLMSRSFFGSSLSAYDIRYWTKALLAAAGLTGQPVVYFVSFDDALVVKIGWAGNLKRRIRTFRTSTVLEPTVHLAIAGDRVLERQLHKRFEADRIRGELFRLSPAIAEFIASRKDRDP
jgi:Meiotically Up-regulated Gene 113 (MUG113) protein